MKFVNLGLNYNRSKCSLNFYLCFTTKPSFYILKTKKSFQKRVSKNKNLINVKFLQNRYLYYYYNIYYIY